MKMSPMEIYSGNFLSAQCLVTASSGAGGVALLYDQKPATAWSSVASSDGVTEALAITFRDNAGQSVARAFDAIMLLNHNVKAMSARYQDTAGMQQAITEAVIANCLMSDLFIDLPATVPGSGLTLNLSATQIADREKSIGELKVCKRVLTLGNAKASFERRDQSKQGYYYTADGSLVSWREYTKRAGTLTLENLPLPDRNTLLSAVETYDFLTFVFHRDFYAREVFEFAVIAPVSETLSRDTGRYTLSLEVAER